MTPCRFLLVLSALAATSAAAAAATDSPPIRFFNVESRVDLDASGAVVAVASLGSEPEAVAKAVAAKVRSLRFTGASREGKPAAATTYVGMFACAEQSPAGYAMSFRYAGHGPTEAGHVAMGYPGVAERSGVPAHYDVFMRVQPDGSAVIEDFVRRDERKRYDADFRRAISQWARLQRFHPETVDGVAVATRVRTEVNFVLTARPGQNGDPFAGVKDCAAAFQLAEQVYGTEEAIDSPVTVSP